MSAKLKTELEERIRRLYFDEPDRCWFIHYACAGLIGEGGAPARVWWIATKNRATGEIVTFGGEDEKAALAGFAAHIESERDAVWVNWNMRDATYGFEAIAERAAHIGLSLVAPPVDRRLDLCAALWELYGNFASPETPGRFPNLARANGLVMRDWLAGEEEAVLAAGGDLMRVRASTLRKIEMLHGIFALQAEGRLRVEGDVASFTPTDADLDILEALARVGRVKADAIPVRGVGQRKMKTSLPTLERAGLVDRAEGPRSGWAITPKGRTLLAQLRAR